MENPQDQNQPASGSDQNQQYQPYQPYQPAAPAPQADPGSQPSAPQFSVQNPPLQTTPEGQPQDVPQYPDQSALPQPQPDPVAPQPAINPETSAPQYQAQQTYQQPAYGQQFPGQPPAAPQYPGPAGQPGYPGYPGQAAAADENPNKSFLVALLLSYFLGGIGADRFYLGKIGTGVAKLLTLGGLGIWHAVDLLLIAFNKVHAKGDNRPLEGYAHNRQWVKIVAIIMIVFNVVIIGGFLLLMVLTTYSGVQQAAKDTSAKTDLHMAASDLYSYYSSNGTYPSDQQYEDGTYRSNSQMQTLKSSDIHYTAEPSGCDGTQVPCTSFKLSTMLPSGQPYSVNP